MRERMDIDGSSVEIRNYKKPTPTTIFAAEGIGRNNEAKELFDTGLLYMVADKQGHGMMMKRDQSGTEIQTDRMAMHYIEGVMKMMGFEEEKPTT